MNEKISKKAQKIINGQGLWIDQLDGEPFLILESWEQHEKLCELLKVEHLDDIIEYGFDDEYATCSDCNAVIRTSPDSYSWAPEYWNSPEGYICRDCIDPTEYLEWLEQEQASGKAISCLEWIDPTDRGYTLILENLEYSFHPSRADDPGKLVKWFNERHISILFIVQPSQFDYSFDVYAKIDPDELNNIKRCLVNRDSYGIDVLKYEFQQYPTPAQNCETALRNLTKPFARIDVSTGQAKEYETVGED